MTVEKQKGPRNTQDPFADQENPNPCTRYKSFTKDLQTFRASQVSV